MIHTPPSDFSSRDAVAAFVLGLRERGLRDTGVLGAMERVPREVFAPRRFADLARIDIALPLPCGQTMTAPSVVATMLVALAVEPGHRVLEIGTGSGYVTALLARLGGRVRSVERFASLTEAAAGRLQALGTGSEVALETGDGLAPEAAGGPYDRILLNGTLPALSAGLAPLIATGGRLVGAVAQAGGPRLVVLARGEDGALGYEVGGTLRLSPLATGRAAAL